jgi:dolichyl-diphosphooligosaccharide--protein glycosyltransferase
MSDAQREDSPSVVDLLSDWPGLRRWDEWYHVPVLGAIFVVMLWIRLRSYDEFVQNGTVYFAGNDAWYHLRQVNYTVGHWPFTMPFDPWTYFPYGTTAGQFGTLYDQLIATAALVVGLGDPSSTLVAKTLLVAPAVFGALTVVPTYLVGKRLGGRLGGLFGAVILMLLPGTFLRRGLVGFADHNVAEPLFQAAAVFAIMVALTVAQRERPVWELVVDRDYDALRSSLLWSVAAGVATALYMWVWPPGVLLVGIVGVYLVLQMVNNYVNGDSPEHVAFVGAVAMSVTAVLMLVKIEEPGFGVTDFGYLQPLLAAGVAAGAVFLAALARWWESQSVDDRGYPVAVFGLIAVSMAAFAAVLPDVFGSILTNLLRTVGFSAGATTRTIGEAQPFLSPDTLQSLRMTATNRIISEYGFTFFTGVVAAIWLAAKPLVRDGDTRKFGYAVGAMLLIGLLYLVPALPAAVGRALGVDPSLVGLTVVSLLVVVATLLVKYDPEELFVLVWVAFIASAAFTQVRFNYYLAVGVAVMNAFLVGQLYHSDYLELDRLKSVTDLSGYQVLAIAAVVLLVLTPVLVVPIGVRNTGNPAADRSSTAWEVAQDSPGSVTEWEGSLDWMSANTPAEGNFGGAGNADQLDYYGTYEYTDDYDYPEGAYGVMSWWDYGHWITVMGERIPNANPFQQGADAAANFLLAPNETQAREVLQGMSEEGDQTRYVMVDWQMATPGSKFGAPTVFYNEQNVSTSDFYRTVYRFNQQGRFSGSFILKDQRYYESLMTRLYLYHGSARDPSPVVVDWEQQTVQSGNGPVTVPTTPQGNVSTVRTFDNMSAARQFVERDGTAQVGGIGSYPSERVSALQHYRLVKVSNSSATSSNQFLQIAYRDAQTAGINPQVNVPRNPAWVKTFERVPGAKVQGSGAPPNSTVRAQVEMKIPTSNSTFTYVQDAKADENGEFSFTLPYATTGYEQYGPENGYTDVSVRANGSYTVTTGASLNESGHVVRHSANLSVGEGHVNGDQEGPLTVELQRSAQELQVSGGSDSSGDSGSSGDAGGSDSSGSDGGSSSESSDSAAVAAPEVTVAAPA